MRVLEIISGFAIEGPLGGIERFGMELVQALDGRQVTPLLCGMWAYGTPYEQGWLERVQAKGIAAFIAADWDDASPYHSFRRAYHGTRAQLAGQKVDIIHSHCQFGDVLAWWLKRPLHARALVRTVHNEREWPRRPERRLLLTKGLFPWLFEAELGVAQQVVDNLDGRPIARLLGKRAIRAYNALNVARFAAVPTPEAIATTKASLGLPPEAVVLGSIGRLTEQKGFGILLEAAVHLRPTHPHTHWLIVGDGPLAEPLRQQAAELGVADVVHFLGPRPDVEALLPTFDAFVSSSLWEGLPTVILESMAADVPVVATPVSGTMELVVEGQTGVLAHTRDGAGLAAAVARLLAMPTAERGQMCAMAAQFVIERFSITAVARQHEAIYEGLLKES